MSPFIAAKKAVEALKDPKKNKVTVFELQKSSLKDEDFAKSFLTENGLAELIVFVSENQGSPLAAGLKALHSALLFKIGWETITDNFLIHVFLPLLNSTNINVRRNALEITALLANDDSFGFRRIDQCIKQCAGDENPYISVIQSLKSTDVMVQAEALNMINSLIHTCNDSQQLDGFELTLEEFGLSKDLKTLLQKPLQDESIKHQIYIYQSLKLRRLLRMKENTYDKNNEEHEALLMKLWNATFPTTTLNSRVSEQWKLMGFQGTDPATDFRGMGLLGLHNLLYFAEVYPEKWREIVKRNQDRKEREYPTAVAGINITQALFEILNVGKPINFKGPPLKVFRVLFDHPNAFEEMYCSTFGVLDRTWDEMNASYMDFSKVNAAVKKQIEVSLDSNIASVKGFLKPSIQDAFGTSTLIEEENNGHPKLKEIKQKLRAEAFGIVLQQRLSFLVEGATFLGINKSKDKKGQYIFLQVDRQLLNLNYAYVSQPNETTSNFSGSVPKGDLRGIVSGAVYGNELQKAKKLDDSLLKRAFKIQTKTSEFELLALNQNDYVVWSDGLRLWANYQALEKDTNDEVNYLADLMIQVKLLEIAGVDIPETEPEIPPPPTNFDFPGAEEGIETE